MNVRKIINALFFHLLSSIIPPLNVKLFISLKCIPRNHYCLLHQKTLKFLHFLFFIFLILDLELDQQTCKILQNVYFYPSKNCYHLKIAQRVWF